MSYYGFKPEPLSANCIICQKNLAYPPMHRPTCPHHSHHQPPPPPTFYPPPPSNRHHPPSCQYPTPPPYNPSYPETPSYPHFPPNPSWSRPTRGYATWVDAFLNENVPCGAVRGGTDIDGQPIYVGRSFHEGDWLPAKVIPGRQCCYVSWNGKEYSKNAFQILSHSTAHWVPGFGGQVPHNAIEGGKTSKGEKLYIGRVMHRGSQTVGKIHPSHKTCYIPFDGKEIGYPSYDVLVSRS